MPDLRYDADNPSNCILLDLETRRIWQGTDVPGSWKLISELSPGAATAWAAAVATGGRDNNWD